LEAYSEHRSDGSAMMKPKQPGRLCGHSILKGAGNLQALKIKRKIVTKWLLNPL
jgi:hypothetical protein